MLSGISTTIALMPFAQVEGAFCTADDAFAYAASLIEANYVEDVGGRLSIIGDFVLPPIDGPGTRDFQTLHFDFGLPLNPRVDQDVARYSALYVPISVQDVSACTRLLPLDAVLGQRTWPPRAELLKRFAAYGYTHGAWNDERGYCEGSFARIVEAADSIPDLPSVKTDPGFLCGLEFQNLDAELAFFARRGLSVGEVTVEVTLQPGQLLVFNNLRIAHGRRGRRAPGELYQRIYGHKHLTPSSQLHLRDSVLGAFDLSTD